MGKSLISNILKTLMFKRSINTSQLARDTHLPQQTLHRIVSGASPNPHGKTLKPIAEFFNINLEQLKGEQQLPESIVNIDLPVISKAKAKEVPIIFWDQIEEYLTSPEEYNVTEYIFADQTLSNTTFATILPDSSMEPYFPKNSLLILDPNPSELLLDRCFVLVKTDAKVPLFRQLIIDGEHQYLKPMNPDLNAFPMRLLKKTDQVLGVMIEFRYRYSSS